MLRLPLSLSSWGTTAFSATLKHELEQSAAHLPLQQGLSTGNHVLDTPITVMVQSVKAGTDVLVLKVGVFYHSIIAGCSCADDPTPISENNEYCVLCLEVNMNDAQTWVILLEQ